MTYKNGDVFEGSFVKGKRNGQGTLKLANKFVYTGKFSP